MRRIPFLIAALVAASGLSWTIRLAALPDPFAADSALAVAIGVLIFTAIAVAGLLLGRGRWTRPFAAGLLGTELLIAAVSPLDLWALITLILTGLGITGLLGPWLRGWLRQRQPANAPGAAPMALTLGSLLVVPLVGVAAPAGLHLAHGLAGATGILLGWAYGRGNTWSIWALRFILPVVLAAAAVFSPPAGAALLLAAAAGIGYVAWNRECRLAVDPLPANLPTPRRPQR